MPSVQNVSYNSSRVQRAYSINNIETQKLQDKIRLLEKERIHRQRLTNQDIRLTSLTLDYVQTCSGYSAEGLAPNKDLHENNDKIENGPVFLYGERIVSRKRRTIRPHSALDKSFNNQNSSEVSSIISAFDVTARPQSSPIRRKPVLITTSSKHSETLTESCYESSKSGKSTPTDKFRPDWLDEPISDVTKILLNAAADNNKRPPVFARNRKFSGHGVASFKSDSHSSTFHRSAYDSAYPIERTGRITDILNIDSKMNTNMSASAWKSHLSQTHAGPVASPVHRKYVLNSKKAINNTKTAVIQSRVQQFMS